MNAETMDINLLKAMVTLFPVGDEISVEDLASIVGVTVDEYQKFSKNLRHTLVLRTKVEYADQPVRLSAGDGLKMAKEMLNR